MAREQRDELGAGIAGGATADTDGNELELTAGAAVLTAPRRGGAPARTGAGT